MSVHRNDEGDHYAWCKCGVVGPLRRERANAQADEQAHASCCSSGGKA